MASARTNARFKGRIALLNHKRKDSTIKTPNSSPKTTEKLNQTLLINLSGMCQ